jgi:hypothetical protein
MSENAIDSQNISKPSADTVLCSPLVVRNVFKSPVTPCSLTMARLPKTRRGCAIN